MLLLGKKEGQESKTAVCWDLMRGGKEIASVECLLCSVNCWVFSNRGYIPRGGKRWGGRWQLKKCFPLNLLPIMAMVSLCAERGRLEIQGVAEWELQWGGEKALSCSLHVVIATNQSVFHGLDWFKGIFHTSTASLKLIMLTLKCQTLVWGSWAVHSQLCLKCDLLVSSQEKSIRHLLTGCVCLNQRRLILCFPHTCCTRDV